MAVVAVVDVWWLIWRGQVPAGGLGAHEGSGQAGHRAGGGGEDACMGRGQHTCMESSQGRFA